MNTSISIIALSTKRCADWERLWRDYQTFYGVVLSENVRASAWDRLVDERSSLFGALALCNDRIIGLVHWFYHPSLWRDVDVCYLQDLFVASERRGAGTGRALIEHVYSHAKGRSAPEVYWHTHESNRTAMKLYDQIATASGFVHYKKTFLPHPVLREDSK